MNNDQFALIRGRVALLLKAARPHLYPEDRLFFDVCRTTLPKPVRAEFDHVIARMEAAGQILRHRVEDEGIKCKLTQEGEAEL